MAYIPTPLDLVDPADSVKNCFDKCNTNFGDIQSVINDLTALLSGGFDYTKTDINGGASTALDSIDGTNLAQGNRALVIKGADPGQVYIYVLDETADGAENAPYLIVPDTNAGTKRWVLASSPAHFWDIATDPTVNSDQTTGAKPGDIWKNGSTMWLCNSAATGAAAWTRILKLGTGGTDACPGNDIRLSDARQPLFHGHVEAEITDLKSYALATHNHDAVYAALLHNHDTAYAALSHNHTGVYSPVSHNHDTTYAILLHNHDAAYAAIGHTHADASASVKGLIQLAGNLSGSAAAPTVVGVKESGGTSLGIGAVTDGQFLKRSGSSVISGDPLQDSGGPMDVVGGRMDLATATNLQWSFLTSNQIRLYDGSKWIIVNCASVPTAANTALDLNGDALAVSNIYDVFAIYSSATAFTLGFSKWASATIGSCARCSAWVTSTAYKIGQRVTNSGSNYVCVTAHTSGTFSTDLSAGKWVLCGTNTDDFQGLYQQNGIWVSGNNSTHKGMRWLGVIYTYSNSGTVNFKDDINNRFIANFYNTKPKLCQSYNTTVNWTCSVTGANSREANAGTGQIRGYFVTCMAATALAAFSCRYSQGAGVQTVTFNVLDGGGGLISQGLGIPTTDAALVNVALVNLGVGYHYITQWEYVTTGTSTASGSLSWYQNNISLFL